MGTSHSQQFSARYIHTKRLFHKGSKPAAQLESMASRIIYFGIAPDSGVLAALSGNGYEVNACGTSIPNQSKFFSSGTTSMRLL
jgi:hypothetical protein